SRKEVRHLHYSLLLLQDALKEFLDRGFPMPSGGIGNALHDHQVVGPFGTAGQVDGRGEKVLPTSGLVKQARSQDLELVNAVASHGPTADLAARLLNLDFVGIPEFMLATSNIFAFHLQGDALHLDAKIGDSILVAPFHVVDNATLLKFDQMPIKKIFRQLAFCINLGSESSLNGGK